LTLVQPAWSRFSIVASCKDIDPRWVCVLLSRAVAHTHPQTLRFTALAALSLTKQEASRLPLSCLIDSILTGASNPMLFKQDCASATQVATLHYLENLFNWSNPGTERRDLIAKFLSTLCNDISHPHAVFTHLSFLSEKIEQ